MSEMTDSKNMHLPFRIKRAVKAGIEKDRVVSYGAV
jgi:hypothetical protein